MARKDTSHWENLTVKQLRLIARHDLGMKIDYSWLKADLIHQMRATYWRDKRRTG